MTFCPTNSSLPGHRLHQPSRILATPELKAKVGYRAELTANSFPSRMPAEFDAKYQQQLRPFSFGKTSRDTAVSNPPRSASQSAQPVASRESQPKGPQVFPAVEHVRLVGPVEEFFAPALIALVWAALAAMPATSASGGLTPIGRWATADATSHIQIRDCGGKLCGTIVWLKEPLDEPMCSFSAVNRVRSAASPLNVRLG